MHNTVLYSHCRGAEEPRVADPCVEPYLFDVLDVFVSPVATVSITFSGPLDTSFDVSSMCFLKLLCVELSGPP